MQSSAGIGFLSPLHMLQYRMTSSFKDDNGHYDPEFVSLSCREETHDEDMFPGHSASEYEDRYFQSVSYSKFHTNLSDPEDANMPKRAQREFVPDNRKDNAYWSRRLKNNDSARKSRLKRKALEKYMEQKLFDLQKENATLKMELATLRQQSANISNDDKNHFLSNELTIKSRNMKEEMNAFVEKHGFRMHYLDSSGSENSKNEDEFCKKLFWGRSQFFERNRSQDLNSEGSCSPASSETNDRFNDLSHPLDLSSKSTRSSPDLMKKEQSL